MMATDDIQQLRKELKHWESAFYIVHQRKPEKKDIAEAPKEIKEKYQVYFKKKAVDQETVANEVALKSDLRDSQSVWGVEFNKTPDTKNGLETPASKSSTTRASLDKLGAKLFQTFARTQSPLCVKSRGVFKNHKESVGPVAEIICGVGMEASALQDVRKNEKSMTVLRNVEEGSHASGVIERFHEASKEESCLDSQDDFVVKGELFKGAEKLFFSRAGASRSTSYQIPRPRLSFLSVNRPLSFTDGNSSDDEISQKDISEASGYKSSTRGINLEACSDIDSGGKDALRNMGKIFQDNCVSEAAVGNKVRSSSTTNLMASQNVVCEQLLDEKTCDLHEHHDKDGEISFDDSLQRSECSKYSSDVSPQIHQRHKKINSSTKSSGRKYSPAYHGYSDNSLPITPSALASFIDPADSPVKSDLSLQQNCNDQNYQASESKTSLVSSVVIAKTGLKISNTAKLCRTTSRSVKSGLNESSVSKKTEVADGSEVESVLPKKSGQRKRKRPLDMAEECSRDVVDDNASENNHQDSVDADESAVATGNKVQPHKTSQRKKSAASLSENYVCLNMKRKGYRRKGAGMTGPQLRRKQWKAKMAARSKSFGSNKCFKCGQEGHWANKCKAQSGSSHDSNPMDINALPAEESEFPSLREAALMSRGMKGSEVTAKTNKDPNDITDIESTILRESWDNATPPSAVVTFADHVEDVKDEMKQALSIFGFSTFRPGQEASICRILQGLSTLVVLSTGGGKSLCYQLPAYLYAKHHNSLTLVISPLVSLMEDQITGLPPGVLGACLHSGMALAQREKVVSSLKEGKVHFLLVSPEAIVERGAASQGSFPPPGRTPPIAFACIDEAHCLSEWSHNFRPSYLRLCKVLRKRYGVKCFLGLTATATKSTAEDVARQLGIDEPEQATIRGASVPCNLVLSASRDENKDEALINLFKGDRFKSCESILIYCSRREQTERVATLIRTSMKTSVDLNESYQPTAKKRRAPTIFNPDIWTAESYHAGLTAAKRRTVQKAFMTGKLRVVVATVAFGMGLDKANVRAVVHYNIAKSFESYVQEIGRAGRDGKLAQCHVFLDSQTVSR